MAKQRKTYEDDDGRVIAKMNVEGMPWYRSGPKDEQQGGPDKNAASSREPLSRRDTIRILFASMKWALLFSLVFSVIMVGFVLFCVFVWFK